MENVLTSHKTIFTCQETLTIELLFIAGRVAYEDFVETVRTKEPVCVDTGVQTKIKRKRAADTLCLVAPSDEFSGYVTEKFIYDQFHNDGEESGSGLGQSLLIMSRLLAHNVSKPFLKSLPGDSTEEFLYQVFPVGAVLDPKLRSAEIIAIDRNPLFDFMFAVGFSLKFMGGVAIISLKNTLYAEKIYRLKSPVVCVKFSDEAPNLLGAGTENGWLWILDISGDKIEIMYKVPGLSYQSACAVFWRGGEIVWSSGSRIFRICRPFITSRRETIRAIVYSSVKDDMLLVVGPKITGLFWHNHSYVASCNDGALRYCSEDNVLEVDRQIENAHLGVVSGIRSIPYCKTMFLTFGSDNAVKLWLWGLAEPLVVFRVSTLRDLYDACWSPLHATIVAACSRNEIYLWDLRRRTHAPISVTYTNHACLTIAFSACGRFLISGSDDGSVIFYGLEKTPPEENLKTLAFFTTLFRCLMKEHRPEVVDKIGRENSDIKF